MDHARDSGSGRKHGPREQVCIVNAEVPHVRSLRDKTNYRAANNRASKQDFAAVSHRRTAVIAALITL